MAGFKPIVDYINEILLTKAFSTTKFAGSSLYSIANTLTQIETDINNENPILVLSPNVITNDGEALTIYPDDASPLLLFHKIRSTQNSFNPKLQRGRSRDVLTRTASCSIIVCAIREKIQMSIEDLDLLILAMMPSSLERESLNGMALKSCFINVAGSSFDADSIYRKEWSESSKPLAPGQLVLEIAYSLGVTFQKECLINPCCL